MVDLVKVAGVVYLGVDMRAGSHENVCIINPTSQLRAGYYNLVSMSRSPKDRIMRLTDGSTLCPMDIGAGTTQIAESDVISFMRSYLNHSFNFMVSEDWLAYIKKLFGLN